MDKSSPVFENFENKMAAMSGRPKINKSTFKIGSGDLGMRVANNERKITTLKNIFKTHGTLSLRYQDGQTDSTQLYFSKTTLSNTHLTQPTSYLV